MRIFILMIALCQVADGQSIIVSGDGRSIVVSGRSEVAPLKTEPVVVKPIVVPAPQVSVPAKPVINTVSRQQFLVSESWCANCPRAKASFRANGWPDSNILTIAQCRERFGFSVPHVPYLFWGDVTVQEASRQDVHVERPVINRSPPNRYIQWPGWGQIDLQTYNRNCNCPMCQRIRGLQQEYQRQLRAYQQTALPDDQQPCPMETVEAMLDAMQLTPNDTLVDLGCGDGRILIAAARRGVKGIGVELDHARAETARQAIRDAGVSSLVSVETGDARDFDTSRATAITAYLYPTLLAELAPKMKAARVAASPYHEVPGLSMVQVGDVWLYNRNEG